MSVRSQKQPIPFMKLSGSGNDFILIDNRDRVVDPKRAVYEGKILPDAWAY